MISSITEGEVKEKEAVVFRGELSANQTVSSNTMTRVNLDNATIDTDNAFVDGKFKPSVAGYYQVSGAVNQYCDPSSTSTVSAIYKNGEITQYGTNTQLTGGSGIVYQDLVSDVIYLDPDHVLDDGSVGDYIELYGQVVGATSSAIRGGTNWGTFLSAHLITGQSSGGSGGDTCA